MSDLISINASTLLGSSFETLLECTKSIERRSVSIIGIVNVARRIPEVQRTGQDMIETVGGAHGEPVGLTLGNPTHVHA